MLSLRTKWSPQLVTVNRSAMLRVSIWPAASELPRWQSAQLHMSPVPRQHLLPADRRAPRSAPASDYSPDQWGDADLVREA